MLSRLDIPVWTSPIAKQIPAVALFVLASVMAMTFATLRITNDSIFVLSCAVIGAATVLALVVSCKTGWHRFETIAITLDFIAIALFRFATGGTFSIFSPLLLIPLAWMASLENRRHAVYAALGGGLVVVLTIPLNYFILGIEPTVTDFQRSLFAPIGYFFLAIFINELSHQARQNLQRARSRELVASADLQKAAAVQRALLPKNEQILPGYQLAGTCVPSRSVGGDFFDWYEIDGGIALTMGDVMGKGVGAGMVAATARAVVRGATSETDPRIALEQMAQVLNNELSDESTFLTLFHARLDAAAGVLDYADAGHGLTLLVHSDGTYQRLMSPDPPLGIVPDAEWTRQRIDIGPGDTLVTFSDGILDLYDGTLTAIDKIALITRTATSAQGVSEALTALAGEQQNDDDVTILVLRRNPVRSPSGLASHALVADPAAPAKPLWPPGCSMTSPRGSKLLSTGWSHIAGKRHNWLERLVEKACRPTHHHRAACSSI